MSLSSIMDTNLHIINNLSYYDTYRICHIDKQLHNQCMYDPIIREKVKIVSLIVNYLDAHPDFVELLIELIHDEDTIFHDKK